MGVPRVIIQVIGLWLSQVTTGDPQWLKKPPKNPMNGVFTGLWQLSLIIIQYIYIIILYYIKSYYIIIFYSILYYIILYFIILYYIKLYYIIVYYIVLYYNITHYVPLLTVILENKGASG